MKKILTVLFSALLLLCVFGFSACNQTVIGNCKHTSEVQNTILEATCSQTGLKRTSCKDCGKIVEEQTIAKLTHTLSDWIIDQEATCKDAGLKHKKCTECNAILEIYRVSDYYTHNYIYGECELCGAIDSTYMTDGLLYRLINNDTEYEVFGYVPNSADVIIPAVYKGKPVTSIAEEAFNECYSLRSVVIPDGVTSIGDYAFCVCQLLTNIVIPDSVKTIGEGAFYCCFSLTTIYCEAESQPSGWDSTWNKINPDNEYAKVIWGYKDAN